MSHALTLMSAEIDRLESELAYMTRMANACQETAADRGERIAELRAEVAMLRDGDNAGTAHRVTPPTPFELGQIAAEEHAKHYSTWTGVAGAVRDAVLASLPEPALPWFVDRWREVIREKPDWKIDDLYGNSHAAAAATRCLDWLATAPARDAVLASIPLHELPDCVTRWRKTDALTIENRRWAIQHLRKHVGIGTGSLMLCADVLEWLATVPARDVAAAPVDAPAEGVAAPVQLSRLVRAAIAYCACPCSGYACDGACQWSAELEVATVSLSPEVRAAAEGGRALVLASPMPHAVEYLRSNPSYFKESLRLAVERVGPKDAYGHLLVVVDWLCDATVIDRGKVEALISEWEAELTSDGIGWDHGAAAVEQRCARELRALIGGDNG